MKTLLQISLLLLLWGNTGLYAQDGLPGYTVEGNEIIFNFNRNDYKDATNELNGKRVAINKLDIAHVAVAGNFNNWSRHSWKMSQKNDSVYVLTKKLTDLDRNAPYEFKFVINGKFWAEPPTSMPNIVPAQTPHGGPLNTYNLQLFAAYPTAKGNVPFKLKGFQDAKKVIVCGSFNKWNENLFEMKPSEDGWRLTLQLPPDTYEYRFIVDGRWMEDPRNPYFKENEYGGKNSVVQVMTYTTFYLHGFTDANEVVLAGDFNNWNEHRDQMKKTDSGWTFTTRISGGKHHYKFIVDGKWILDPANSVKEYDGNGHINSVMMVR